MRAGALLAMLAMLAACDAAPPEPERPPAELPGTAGAPPALAPVPDRLSPGESAALADRDCRVVVEAYLTALERGAFAYAAEFWDDPVVDGARLEALFAGYVTPRMEIAGIQEEGAAGTVFCSVTGALVDASDPGTPPRPGEIVLARVNDVPGASAAQLRWTIRSSTLIEPMERSGRGEPA